VSPTAIALILVAAVAHACWNMFSKQAASAGAVCFVWLFFTVGAAAYAPVTAIVWVLARPRLAGLPLVFLAGTAVIHVAYALLLQSGYQFGDLSVVYPIGRGSGALLAALAGVVLLGERPGPVSVAGIVLVIGGVIVIGLPGRRAAGAALAVPAEPAAPALARRFSPAVLGISFALLTGISIAVYTLWDKYAVATLQIPPVLEDWAANLGVAVGLAPLALRDRPRLARVWRDWRRQVLGAAVLSPLAYILVLTAMRFTAVAITAPCREISVLFGVLLGRRLLGEGAAVRRLAAAAAIVAGIIVIAVG